MARQLCEAELGRFTVRVDVPLRRVVLSRQSAPGASGSLGFHEAEIADVAALLNTAREWLDSAEVNGAD